MATRRKKWPHECEWARLDCIALAREGRTILLTTLDEIERPATLRQVARAIDKLREIETKLHDVKGDKSDVSKSS